MLVMQTNVVGQKVERSIVRERFRNLRSRGHVLGCLELRIQDVVFCDEMGCARVKRASKEGAEYQVDQSVGSSVLHDDTIEQYLGEDV